MRAIYYTAPFAFGSNSGRGLSVLSRLQIGVSKRILRCGGFRLPAAASAYVVFLFLLLALSPAAAQRVPDQEIKAHATTKIPTIVFMTDFGIANDAVAI